MTYGRVRNEMTDKGHKEGFGPLSRVAGNKRFYDYTPSTKYILITSFPFFSPSKRHTLFHVTLLRDTQPQNVWPVNSSWSPYLLWRLKERKHRVYKPPPIFCVDFFFLLRSAAVVNPFFPLLALFGPSPFFLTHSFQHYTPKEERKKVNWVTVSCRLTLPKRWLLLKGSLWRSSYLFLNFVRTNPRNLW